MVGPVLPLLNSFFNKYPARIAPFRFADLMNFIIARPQPRQEVMGTQPVPARSEAGNIEEILRRVPEMGAGTEVIFVEGHSSDDTYEAIANAIARFPHKRSKLLRRRERAKVMRYVRGLLPPAEGYHDSGWRLDCPDRDFPHRTEPRTYCR
jgi:hypothetical protein